MIKECLYDKLVCTVVSSVVLKRWLSRYTSDSRLSNDLKGQWCSGDGRQAFLVEFVDPWWQFDVEILY